ncbi:hypothetical protein [Sulfuricella sp.]|uniref:hypothetical protein n=1 Tax=Sulfuricella sp. TaxID=2099377 RepID=UPI002BD193A0|nr:hypothetical protein [Sulfuricella sp.]HUX64911.1 hypothetical protein [Sulfuricella sp.]
MVVFSEPCVLHEDAFYEYFKPIRHADTKPNIWGGLGLETFGEDFEIVRSHDPGFVWTVTDGDSGDQWITTGVHYVNRICYLVTEKPHDWIPVEFRIRMNGHPLTPVGLNRQLLKLDRLVTEHKYISKLL